MRTQQLAAISHQPWLEYRHTLPDGTVCVRIRVGRGDWDEIFCCVTCNYKVVVSVIEGGISMRRLWRDDLFDWYEAQFLPEDPRICYCFRLVSGERTLYMNAEGFHDVLVPEAGSGWFVFAHAWPAEKKPDWAIGAVGYQIFPDRFRRAGKAEKGIEPWSSKRLANQYRYGGNLKGIREAVPYLKSLGVDIVYMTPLFVSDTSHRYNTFDYYTIDPLLGDAEELTALADDLHSQGMRIMLDGVFNHCGTDFAPFQDAKKRGKASPYYDWFFFDDKKYACGYATFGHEPYMPKLNLQNPEAARYFCEVGRHWLSACHVDGWRLDVSPEVYPDFWRQYRKAVKAENPEAIMVAECWDDSREWLTQGDMFDSTMHYVLSQAIWKFFAEDTISLQEFDARVNRAAALYPHHVTQVLWNFLGSHDTMRFVTRAGGRVHRLRAAVFFLFTQPGVPIVYYGDELDMDGGHDPGCRKPMAWERVGKTETQAFFERMIRVRKSSAALMQGIFCTRAVYGNGLYAYERIHGEERVLCVINTGDETAQGLVEIGTAYGDRVRNLIDDTVLPVAYGHVAVKLEPGQGAVLTPAT